METLTNHRVDDPEVLAINREELQTTSTTIRAILSKFEFDVFKLYVSGFTYREIAEHLNTHTKSIDNALCRIKMKIEKKLC